MKSLFDKSSRKIAKLVANDYSTSFSLGILLLGKEIKSSIYSIYGFVRYADEIVDSFEGYDQEFLLNQFIEDYRQALEMKISLNPILNAFQEVVNKYKIHSLVDDFLNSMKRDLQQQQYNSEEDYKEYIHGSADVVGLMCLKVFVNGNSDMYDQLCPHAKSLGSAFQKVNFLRDFANDYENLGRSYFPNVDDGHLNDHAKQAIIEDIEKDFNNALIGIRMLPNSSRFGVYVAYKYYKALLNKIKFKSVDDILSNRIRIPNHIKAYLLCKSFIRYRINIL